MIKNRLLVECNTLIFSKQTVTPSEGDPYTVTDVIQSPRIKCDFGFESYPASLPGGIAVSDDGHNLIFDVSNAGEDPMRQTYEMTIVTATDEEAEDGPFEGEEVTVKLLLVKLDYFRAHFPQPMVDHDYGEDNGTYPGTGIMTSQAWSPYFWNGNHGWQPDVANNPSFIQVTTLGQIPDNRFFYGQWGDMGTMSIWLSPAAPQWGTPLHIFLCGDVQLHRVFGNSLKESLAAYKVDGLIAPEAQYARFKGIEDALGLTVKEKGWTPNGDYTVWTLSPPESDPLFISATITKVANSLDWDCRYTRMSGSGGDDVVMTYTAHGFNIDDAIPADTADWFTYGYIFYFGAYYFYNGEFDPDYPGTDYDELPAEPDPENPVWHYADKKYSSYAGEAIYEYAGKFSLEYIFKDGDQDWDEGHLLVGVISTFTASVHPYSTPGYKDIADAADCGLLYPKQGNYSAGKYPLFRNKPVVHRFLEKASISRVESSQNWYGRFLTQKWNVDYNDMSDMVYHGDNVRLRFGGDNKKLDIAGGVNDGFSINGDCSTLYFTANVDASAFSTWDEIDFSKYHNDQFGYEETWYGGNYIRYDFPGVAIPTLITVNLTTSPIRYEEQMYPTEIAFNFLVEGYKYDHSGAGWDRWLTAVFLDTDWDTGQPYFTDVPYYPSNVNPATVAITGAGVFKDIRQSGGGGWSIAPFFYDLHKFFHEDTWGGGQEYYRYTYYVNIFTAAEGDGSGFPVGEQYIRVRGDISFSTSGFGGYTDLSGDPDEPNSPLRKTWYLPYSENPEQVPGLIGILTSFSGSGPTQYNYHYSDFSFSGTASSFFKNVLLDIFKGKITPESAFEIIKQTPPQAGFSGSASGHDLGENFRYVGWYETHNFERFSVSGYMSGITLDPVGQSG